MARATKKLVNAPITISSTGDRMKDERNATVASIRAREQLGKAGRNM